MDITFRKIEHDDLVQCAEIFVSVYSKPPWNETWELDNAFDRLNNFIGSNQSIGILSEINGSIIGFLIGEIERWQSNLHFYLKEVCINLEYQRKGFGTRLLKELIQHLRKKNVTNIYLITKGNSISSSFYNSLDFSVNERLKIMGKKI